MLGGSGCQGKRSCQENREETTGTRTEADQSESSPLVRPPPPRPVVRNSPATHGRQLGMARTVYAWRVSLGLKIYDCLILDYCCLQTTKIKKYVTSQYWAFTIDII